MSLSEKKVLKLEVDKHVRMESDVGTFNFARDTTAGRPAGTRVIVKY